MGIESIVEKFNEVKDVVNGLEADVLKSVSGNAAASSRVRKALKVITSNVRDIRKTSLAFAKAEKAAKVAAKAAETK